MIIEDEIQKYLEDLENEDVQVRNFARQRLVGMGADAIQALINQLKTDSENCRWEAAKILGEIGDLSSAGPLVEALLDESINVHWVASEALIKMGRDAILPLLEGIVRHFDSLRFRQGAYHILHVFENLHQLDPKTQEVLDALRSIEPSASAPWAAERAIESIKFG